MARARDRLLARQARREHSPGGDPSDCRGHRQLAGRPLLHRGRPRPGDRRALAVEQGEPPDEPAREHRRHAGGRRSQLHDARHPRPRTKRQLVHEPRHREGVARLPAAGAHLHRGADRVPQPAARPPTTADGDVPEPISRMDWGPPAGRRLRLVGSRRPGTRGPHGVGGRAAEPHGQRRLRGDVHGCGPCGDTRRRHRG